VLTEHRCEGGAGDGRGGLGRQERGGLSVPYVANLENGRGNPTLAALRRLAGALGVPLRDLLDPDGPATAAWPASLQRFSEQPRLRRDARWLARELGVDEHRLRAQLLQGWPPCPSPRTGRWRSATGTGCSTPSC